MVTTTHGSFVQVIGLMLIGGPALVFSGLRKLNEKRVLENTPRSKVRSAAMGLVELAGMAQPVKAPVMSPVSQLACCWWRCRVEELRSNGKSASWVTVHQAESHTFFYLQDETARVVVDPAGAELHVLATTRELNALTRTALAPVLTGWGLDDMSWFGSEKRLRLTEEAVPDSAPLFVLGELVSLTEPPQAREERFRVYLEKVKSDPARMAEADTNKDGQVDADEWDAFRAQLWAEFSTEESKRQAQDESAIAQMVKAPANGTFVIGTRSPQDLEESLAWLAPAAMLGGVAAGALGVWLAFVAGWSPFIIVGCVGIGFALSIFFKSRGGSLWPL